MNVAYLLQMIYCNKYLFIAKMMHYNLHVPQVTKLRFLSHGNLWCARFSSPAVNFISKIQADQHSLSDICLTHVYYATESTTFINDIVKFASEMT